MAELDLGISRDDFFNHHFEKSPYFKPSAWPGETISLAEIEQLISTWEPADPLLQIFMNGAVPQSEYIEVIDDIDGRRTQFIAKNFQALLSGGATLVLNRVDTKLAIARRLCRHLTKFTNEPITNGFALMGKILSIPEMILSNAEETLPTAPAADQQSKQ